MKIKYNVSEENLFKYLNESMAILTKRKVIENYDGSVIYNYFVKNVFMLILYLFMLVVFNVTIFANNIRIGIFVVLWNFFAFFMLTGYIYILVHFVITYKKQKESLSGTLIFEENNIIDKDEKVQVGFKINDIKYVVIGKYCVMIIFNNNPVGFRYPVSYSERIINGIKKYKDEFKIINLDVE